MLVVTVATEPAGKRNLRFAETLERMMKGRGQRETARAVGLSQTHIGNLLWGSVPRYQTLVQVAEGLELEPDEKAELFRAAGYPPPEGTDESPASNRDLLAAWVVDMAEQFPLAAGELEVPLTRGLAEVHRLCREEFEIMLAEDTERLREIHEAAAKAAEGEQATESG